MTTLIYLIIASIISIFIPHNSKKYNLSLHSRLFITLTLIWSVILFLNWIKENL
jgi:hypothetical protein